MLPNVLTKSLAASLVLAGLSLPSSAQIQFDYITFDQLELDPGQVSSIYENWGILVNTGVQPIALQTDWQGGLWYTEASAKLGALFFLLNNPFADTFLLQPGEAVGDDHPLLLAQLKAGEVMVGPAGSNLISNMQVLGVWPAADFDVQCAVQAKDQLAITSTHFVQKTLPLGVQYRPLSAKRTKSTIVLQPVVPYGTPCFPGVEDTLTPKGQFFPKGPPYSGSSSNLPEVGNTAFGLQVRSEIPGATYILGVDLAPGSIPLFGCELLLALTPNMLTFSGTIPLYVQTVPLPIPNNPALAGALFFAQAVLFTPQIRTTNALFLTVVDSIP